MRRTIYCWRDHNFFRGTIKEHETRTFRSGKGAIVFLLRHVNSASVVIEGVYKVNRSKELKFMMLNRTRSKLCFFIHLRQEKR